MQVLVWMLYISICFVCSVCRWLMSFVVGRQLCLMKIWLVVIRQVLLSGGCQLSWCWNGVWDLLWCLMLVIEGICLSSWLMFFSSQFGGVKQGCMLMISRVWCIGSWFWKNRLGILVYFVLLFCVLVKLGQFEGIF